MFGISITSKLIGKDVGTEVPIDGGKKIVLTASRAEMSQYNYDPFVAFTCTFPYKLVPGKYRTKWLRPITQKDGGNKYAPYGLRKIESILIGEFGKENVIVAHHDNLGKYIGPKTKLVGISTMDPLGLAYVSTTYNSILSFGGEALNCHEFNKLISEE